ncbi:hypothetical protein IQ266_24585 [filamentous cyanobacterium LEGE 11480]|uniref:Uncharacterized protein n=1 Tax=Romeriopsis navalis LEGE 11480 TaxID=2777977 RepID=A0A928VUT3_9CYAN|nr:hypothetical protein [Romeriopsis navalis LEGE 11480]
MNDFIQQAQHLEQQLILQIDAPASVKLQVKQITLIQKQLRALKKAVNAEIRLINQNATQTGPDSLVSVGLEVFGKRKLAGRVRAGTRRAIDAEKKAARQPYMAVRDAIDRILLRGDQLKIEAEKYLLEQ